MQDHDPTQQCYEALAESLARIQYFVLRSLNPEGQHYLYQLARASGELVDTLSETHAGPTQAHYAAQRLSALMAEPKDVLLQRYSSAKRLARKRPAGDVNGAAAPGVSTAGDKRTSLLLGMLGCSVLLAFVLY